MISYFILLIVLVSGTDVKDAAELGKCLTENGDCSLTQDISLSSWTSISKFSGSLNGNLHSITSLTNTFIKELTNANIFNIKLALPDTKLSTSFADVGTNSNFTNIEISGDDVKVEASTKYYGLLVSYTTKCSFESIKVELTSFSYSNSLSDEIDVGIISGKGGGTFKNINITIKEKETYQADVLFFGHLIGSCQDSSNFDSITIQSNTLDLTSTNITKKPQYGGLCGWALSYNANNIIITIDIINMHNQTPYIYGSISGQIITDATVNKATIEINNINMDFISSTSTSNSYIGMLIGAIQCNVLVLNEIEITVGIITIKSTDSNTIIELGSIIGTSIASFDINNIKASISSININVKSNIYIGGFTGESTSYSNSNLNMNVKNGILIEYKDTITVKSSGSVYFGGISTLFRGSDSYPYYMIINYKDVTIESNKVIFGGLFAQAVSQVSQAFTTFNSVVINSKDISIGGLIGSDIDIGKIGLSAISSTVKESFTIINSLQTIGDSINKQNIGGFVGVNENSFTITSSYVIIKKMNIATSLVQTVYGSIVGVNDNTNIIIGSKIQINELTATKSDKEIYTLINGKESKVTTIKEIFISVPLSNDLITISNDYNNTSYMIKCDDSNKDNSHCDDKMKFEIGEDKYWNINNLQDQLLVITTLPNYINDNLFTTTSSTSTERWDLTKWNIPLSGSPSLLYFTSKNDDSSTLCRSDGECSKGQICSNNKCINLSYCNNILSTTSLSTCLFNTNTEGICLNSICYPKCTTDSDCSSYNSHSTCINNACYISCDKDGDCYHEEKCITSTKACNLLCKTKDQCNSNEWCDRNTCNKCPSECSECNTNLICTKCESGYSLLNNKCLTSCSNGYYNKDGVCEKCDNKCNTCNGVSTNCTTCKEGFILYNSDCVSACPDGTVRIDNNCVLCDSSCKTCSVTTTRCSSCNTGKYFFENSCIDSCNNGYIHNKDNICEKCPENQFRLNNQCVSVCTGSTYSNINTGNCDSCNSTCGTCNNIPTNCTSCKTGEGYYLQKTKYPFLGKCVTKEEGCNDGYYPENSNYTCNDCTKGCKRCRDEKYCTSCEDMYILKGGGRCVFFTDDRVDAAVMEKPITLLFLLLVFIIL